MKRHLTSLMVALILGLGIPANAVVTGQWDFNSGNLSATVGADLTDFGLTPTVFTTATIGGSTANVMGFPACAIDQGYVMTHGIAPNGGVDYVNQYTLIMDIMFPAASDKKWRSFLQTNTGNSNDGDLFVNPDNGIGIDGNYSGTISADTWHRVAFVFDLTLSSSRLKKYIDGFLVGEQNLDGVDGRWALDPIALLFADNDGDTAAGFVNSIQIHDVPLTTANIFALGKPTAAGIPATIPVITDLAVTTSQTNATSVVGMNVNFAAIAVGSGTYTYQWYKGGALLPSETSSKLYLTNIQSSAAGNYTVVVNNGLQTVTNSPPIVLTVNGIPPAFVTGQWDFNGGNLAATCGQPLQYFDATVQADTSFGTTTSYGISDIAGQPATVMYCVPSVSSWGGLIATHGIAPNGGGTFVNQYTVIIDLLYPSLGWSSLWQTDVANASDGEAFFNDIGGLGISGQYHGALSPGVWHRVVLAYDLTRKEFSKYVDGVNLLSGVAVLGLHDSQILGSGLDGRWSLDPTALLLADNDGDWSPMYVSSFQIRNGRMTDASVAAMGAPTANKIPGSIKAVKSGSNITIEWTGNVLESALSPIGPWTEVTGAAHPYPVTSPIARQFFRVRQ